MPEEAAAKPHIVIPWSPETLPYTSPRLGRGRAVRHPTRIRAQHAQALTDQFELLRDVQSERTDEQTAVGLAVENGLYLSFESATNHELKFESLEARTSGIELCNLRLEPDRQIATVFVPEGKLDILINKVLAYGDPANDSPKGKPRNQELVESIDGVKEAALRALWTDDDSLFPDDGVTAWWEVWLRTSSQGVDYEAQLREAVAHLGMEMGVGAVRFLDQTIVLVKASVEQLSRSSRILNSFAEVRAPKTTAALFVELDNEE